jgi:sarcosine oxidase, subunit gamma
MAETVVIPARTEPVTDRRRVSPAAHLADRFVAADVGGLRAVRLREVPFLTMVGLRTKPGSPASRRLETRLGTDLPDACGVVTSGAEADAADVTLLWLSPDEFLVVSEQQPAELTSALVEALDEDPGSATDLSANRTTFELEGPSARQVLEKGCPLDLHPRTFHPGTAYVTLLGSVPVIVWKVADEFYRILPRSSFADFLGGWLIDAMAEFKAPEIP